MNIVKNALVRAISGVVGDIDVSSQVKQVQGGDVSLASAIKAALPAVFMMAGIVAVIVIIIGGVSYMLSRGDSQKVQKGKNTILYGIIGLVVVLLSFAIVSFVLGRL